MTNNNKEELSDKELVGMMRRGDQMAFSMLFERYNRTMFRLAMFYLKDAEAARDVVQDVFTKLWVLREGLDISSSVNSYLMTMTRNQLLNWIRTRSRLLARNYALVQEEQDDGLEEKIFGGLDIAKRDSELHKAIDCLPPQQKMVVTMRCSGYSNGDIAEMTGLSQNTVKTHYAQGLKRLRQILSEAAPLLLLLTINM